MDAKRKKLVFHFYTFPNFKENEAIQIHLKCLKHYHSIFTDAVFVIAVDDINDHSLIRETQEALLDCGFETVSFIVEQNTVFREAKTFYDEVVSKIETLDSLVFFGHTKGITNFKNFPGYHESIKQWIHGLYYLSLNFMGEATFYLLDAEAPFFGGMLHLGKEEEPLGYYCGTFFWVNPNSIVVRKTTNGTDYRPNLTGRVYAERYPMIISKWNKGWYGLASHLSRGSYVDDVYKEAPSMIKYLCADEREYNNFLAFVNSDE